MSHRILPGLVAATTIALAATVSQADVLYSLSTDAASVEYDPSVITTASADHVTGPTASEVADGDHGLIRFNNNVGWFSLIGTGSMTIDFSTAYFEFTVAADPGYALNLTSLDFLSARGGTSGSRQFDIYAAVNGDAFNQATDLILDVNVSGDAGTRDIPAPFSVDLTAARYQDIDSITFRYYPQTNDDGRSIEFNDMTVNGSVSAIPEPASLALLGAGGLMLAFRRRN